MAISSDPLVSSEWVAARLQDPALRLVDASWWFPHEKRDGLLEFEAAHLPGAVYFDIDQIADLSDPSPHMLPSPSAFGERVGRLGLGDASSIVVYETEGPRSAARAWWSLRAMGHNDVRVLDGGLRTWRSEGRPVSNRPVTPAPSQFSAVIDRAFVRDLEDMYALIEEQSGQIVDARPSARFSGAAPEPREGLKRGHMPGAFNLPHADFYDPRGLMKDPVALRGIFEAAGVDLTAPVIATCGSGITACTIALAMARLGLEAAVYDGSWAEWGSRVDTPVVTGL